MKSISDQIEACNSSSSCSGEGSSESLSQRSVPLVRINFWEERLDSPLFVIFANCDRASTLDAHTKPGREPSKAIILLMLQIFEALQNGMMSVLWTFGRGVDGDRWLPFSKLLPLPPFSPVRACCLFLIPSPSPQSEPASEKTIKDFIAESCGQYGLKPTNRGSIAGR